MNSSSATKLVLTKHPLRDGERERQIALLKRNATVMNEYGSNRRGGYAAVAAYTPQANSVAFSEERTEQASGWWSIPEHASRDRAILFIHGGGYHLGDASSYRGFTSQLAARTKCAVFSVDYPLSPENKFPAAFDAAVKARKWLSSQAFSHIALVGCYQAQQEGSLSRQPARKGEDCPPLICCPQNAPGGHVPFPLCTLFAPLRPRSPAARQESSSCSCTSPSNSSFLF